jgi:hypothetical protein
MINEVFMEDVRCFHGAHTVPIRPITLIVGENSTGKTTFLAMIRAAWQLGAGNLDPDFNEAPFLLGAFDDLHSGVRRRGREPGFAIGGRSPVVDGTLPGIAAEASFIATFDSGGGQPRINGYNLAAGAYETTMAWSGPPHGWLSLTTPVRTIEIPQIHPSELRPQYISEFVHQVLTGRAKASDTIDGGAGAVTPDEVRALFDLPRAVTRGLGAQPVALAPIRSEPRRNYSPQRENAEPYGSHVPMVLASLSAREPDAWKDLRARLRNFGQASGLLQDITVERKGQKPGDPFQVRVSLAKRGDFNLVDVGYGVSQGLPIIVDAMLMPRSGTLLMQQPEVHLHPRAQAALGDLCVDLLAQEDKRFVVETHSDYLIDRIRMRIREGSGPKPGDVVILYFERDGRKVKVHPIELDAQANLIDVPPGYRRFFLEESSRLLGW